MQCLQGELYIHIPKIFFISILNICTDINKIHYVISLNEGKLDRSTP